jgi:CheY-like chemotaxis protein
MLESLGITQVDKALNGRLALEKVRTNSIGVPNCPNHQPFSVIFTDNIMPIMNGTEFANILHQWQ